MLQCLNFWFRSANLASKNGSHVKLKCFSSDIEVVSLAKSICKHFLRLRQFLSFGCRSVQLTEESLGAVVLKIENVLLSSIDGVTHLVLVDHVVLPDVLLVSNGHIARHIADFPNRDRVQISNLDQSCCPFLPGRHVRGPAPSVVPWRRLVVEDVGLVVGQVVARVVVVSLRVGCSSSPAVSVGSGLGQKGQR